MQITKTELQKLSIYEKNYLNFLSEYLLYKSFEPAKFIIDYSRPNCAIISIFSHSEKIGFDKLRHYRFYGKNILEAEKFLKQFKTDFPSVAIEEKGVQ